MHRTAASPHFPCSRRRGAVRQPRSTHFFLAADHHCGSATNWWATLAAVWCLVSLGPVPAAPPLLLQVHAEDRHTQATAAFSQQLHHQLTKTRSNERTSPGFEARWDGHFTFSLSGHQEHLPQSAAAPVPKSKDDHLLMSSTPDWQSICNLCLTSSLFDLLH